MSSFDDLIKSASQICAERDFADWFFHQQGLVLSKPEQSGGGQAFTVKRLLPKPEGKGDYNPRFEIIGHSYENPFLAIALAKEFIEQQK